MTLQRLAVGESHFVTVDNFRFVGKPHLTPSEFEPDSLGLPTMSLAKRGFFQHPL